jgi:hypothetical protein
MYYKVKALADAGKKIILHYYKYNLSRSTAELDNCCAAVYHYPRKPLVLSLPTHQPFIIASRINKELVDRLNADDYPVLLEGLHCGGLIPFINKKERIMLRMHNEEASYYKHLAGAEAAFIKRQYFLRESKLLHDYQVKMDKGIRLAALSQSDIEIFRNTYRFNDVHFIPCFVPWQQLSISEGTGDYCLYHGNMLVSENEQAAAWLIETVFGNLPVPLVIAGKGISKTLRKKAENNSFVTFVNNPSIRELDKLISEAHTNVLPSMNRTGVKLKLLNALLNGRHCITNTAGVMGSDINAGAVVKNSVGEWKGAVAEAMAKSFTAADIETRKDILLIYNNRQNAEKLSALL